MRLLISRFSLLMLGMVVAMGSFAGSPMHVLMYDDNDPSTRLDDQLKLSPLTWPSGSEMQFLYNRNGQANQILLPTLNTEGISNGQVIEAITEAIKTWNGAKYGSHHFSEVAIPSDMMTHPFDPNGGYPSRVAIDGFNLITFTDDEAFTGEIAVAATIFTFFTRDFDFDEALDNEVDYQYLEVWTSEGSDEDDRTILVDFDFDGRADLAIPLQKYEAADLIDCDITFDPAMTSFFNVWPQDKGDIPESELIDLYGSVDIQATLTTMMGICQGVAFSYIVDSAMYPYFQNSSGDFPSDPYRKRQLQFDDEMGVGLVSGSNFGDDCGTIAGQILNGDVIQRIVTVDDDGVIEIEEEDEGANQYVPMVPVFVGKRLGGEELGLPHPDNVIANPRVADENQGTYRMFAQVLAGQDLIVPVGLGLDFDFGLTDPDDDAGDPPGQGDDEEEGDDEEDPNAGFFTTLSSVNSNFLIPGLDATDEVGNPIDYAVYLGALSDEEFPVSPGQSIMMLFVLPFDYPAEFYGGPDVPIEFGKSASPVEMTLGDDLFENGFITAEVNQFGRFAASINDGIAILSGYQSGPSSFVQVESPKGKTNNHIGTLGDITEPLIIQDDINDASAIWTKLNDFSMSMNIQLTNEGGETTIESGMKVSYVLTNSSDENATYTVRQMIDTFLFGRENPVYVVDGQQVSSATSYAGDSIPQEIQFQSTVSDPKFMAYVTIDSRIATRPSVVKIATLNELNDSSAASGQAISRTIESLGQDTGIMLAWEDIFLSPGQSQVVSFVVGFNPTGNIIDTWVPYPEAGEEGELTGAEDDPDKVVPVQVQPGQITEGIDIITNTGDAANLTGLMNDFRLVAVDGGFPETDFISAHGALGDLDNDGDLDCVVAAFGYGSDAAGGAINRIYFNKEKVGLDGKLVRFFDDVTFGEDKIPNTPDDRVLPTRSDSSRGVVLADFDGDNDLDIFFTNVESGNRFYENMGPDNIGFFEDISAEVLPGLLNSGYSESFYQQPYRVTAGDIDSDGDLDLIISHELSFWDGVMVDIEGVGLVKTYAFLDAERYDGADYGDGLMSMGADYFGGPFVYTEQVLINQINQPVYAQENQSETLPSGVRGFYFVDETLGTDNRTGTLTSLLVQRPSPDVKYELINWDPSELDRMPPVYPNMFGLTTVDEAGDGGEVQNVVPSPMGISAVEPILGPYFNDNSLDLISIRNAYWGTWGGEAVIPETNGGEGEGAPHVVQNGKAHLRRTPDPIDVGMQQVFFRNMDIFSAENEGSLGGDGTADGYFACMNYNMDYGLETGQDLMEVMLDEDGITSFPETVATASGLFAYTISPESVVGETTPGLGFVYDAFPLFMGIPDSNPGNYIDDDQLFLDIFPAAVSGYSSYAGVLGDWEGRNSPMPMISRDEVGLHALAFDEAELAVNGSIMESGVWRSISAGLVSGTAISYNTPFSYAYQGGHGAMISNPIAADGDDYLRTDKVEESPYEVTSTEAYGLCAADFDRDGDADFVAVTTTDPGITSPEGLLIIGGDPTTNQLWMANGVGGFANRADLLMPNIPSVSTFCLTGDLDNDSDMDLVVLNAGESNVLYLNSLFNQTPDLGDDDDAPMFYEATLDVIPQTQGVSAAPNMPIDSKFSGVTVNTIVDDFDMNGLPDLLLAEGGKFTQSGDVAKLWFNGGKPGVNGVQVYHPAGAPYPAPVTKAQTFGSGRFMVLGYLGLKGFMIDAASGDVDNDGDPDLLLLQNLNSPELEGEGMRLSPQLWINRDSDDPLLGSSSSFWNSVPDGDDLGDGIFNDESGRLENLIDPEGNPEGVILKKLGRKVVFADVNGDRYLDIIIANGREGGGAPNVLMFNNVDDPGSFTDQTEKKLPAALIGDLKWGVIDNTQDLAVADFDCDGDCDIVFANDTSNGAPVGFRFLFNDGTGRFIESEANTVIPSFVGPDYRTRAIAVGDVDKLGEATEDVNFNGVLDLGEDLNDNGQIDFEDLPTESEDLNGNGVLDPGEDGLIDSNGVIDQVDLNGDGLITARCEGIWDSSLDIYVSFDQGVDSLLMNYFNTWPMNMPVDQAKNRRFVDESLLRFSGDISISLSRGATMGDVDLDGDLDIVVAQFVGGVYRFVTLWRNETFRNEDGYLRYGRFTNASYEVPFFRSQAHASWLYEEIDGTWSDLPAFPSTGGINGFAHDVDLVDYDLDGDLDMFVSCTGTTANQVAVGSLNVFYENRVIGDGFNKRVVGINRQPGSPIVYAVFPKGGKRGQVKKVDLTGDFFSSDVRLSFGEGITVLETHMTSANKMTATISIAEDALLGARQVTVYDSVTGRITKTKSGAFVVYEGMPGTTVPNRIWELME